MNLECVNCGAESDYCDYLEARGCPECDHPLAEQEGLA